MNQRNPATVDELVSPDFDAHSLFFNPYTPARFRSGSWVDVIKQNIDKNLMDLEDAHTTIDQVIAAGDKVVTVMTTTGTRNGKRVSFASIDVTRFEDGRMVEGWDLWDRLGVYQQLGVVPETPELLRQVGLEP